VALPDGLVRAVVGADVAEGLRARAPASVDAAVEGAGSCRHHNVVKTLLPASSGEQEIAISGFG
jgi:hypothetical protein